MTMHFNCLSLIIAAPGWVVLADSALKSALILLAALALTQALRRASAAVRHLVWTLAVYGTLALPLLSTLLPGWRILPAWMNQERQPLALASSPAYRGSTDFASRVSSLPQDATTDSATTGVTPPAIPDARPVPKAGVSSSSTTASPATISAASAPHRLIRLRWQSWLLIAWASGVLIMLIPMLLSLPGLYRLGRRCTPFESAPWNNLLHELAGRLNLRRHITLLRGRNQGMPMTWGIIRPRLLLPPEADGWPMNRRRVVLMHELAHIQRGDFLTQLIAHIARAVYWFNPLIWIASRQIALESEGACDDCVLAHEARASDYAEHLLTVAAGLKEGALLPLAAIAMARSSRLEGRLMAILDADRNRRALNMAGIVLAVAVLLSSVLPLSMIRAARGSESRKTIPASPTSTPTRGSTSEEKKNDARADAHREVLEAELKQARDEAAVLDRQYQAGLVDRLTVQSARDKVKVLEAELTGDPVKVAEVRLVAARRRLETTSKLHAAGMLTHLDLERAKGDVAVAEAKLREAAVAAGRAGGGKEDAGNKTGVGPPAPGPSTRPALAFGQEVAGLRAAAEITGAGGAVPLGMPLDVRFHIRNVSTLPITIAGGITRQDSADRVIIEDSHGRRIPGRSIWYSGWTVLQTENLAPGQTAVFKSTGLAFLPEGYDDKKVTVPIGNYVLVPPGRYTVRYRLNFPDLVSVAPDWTGELETAPITFDVAVPAGPRADAAPSKKAAERAAKLKKDLRNFNLDLQYNGPQDKPYYRLRLSVAAPVPVNGKSPFDRQTQITEAQAGKIIDHLAAEGFLDEAHDLEEWGFIPKATEPGYSLQVPNYYADLGWNLPMLHRLDRLKSALEGDAAKDMDLLLGRMGGHRKQWEKKG